MQVCKRLSKCSTRPCKPAGGRRSFRWGHASLQEAVVVFDEAMQVCERLSKCSTRPCKPAGGCRTVRRDDLQDGALKLAFPLPKVSTKDSKTVYPCAFHRKLHVFCSPQMTSEGGKKPLEDSIHTTYVYEVTIQVHPARPCRRA